MKHLLWITVTALAVTAGCKKSDKMSMASVSTTTASSITANGAQSGGTIGGTGGSTISKSGICWAAHNNPSVSDSIIASNTTSTGSFTIALSNLNANTEYYVRAFAINGTGTSYGNVDSFMTAKGMPSITTTAISNIAPLTAHSGGTVTNDGGASVTARGLCWSTSAHPTTANFKTSDSLGIGSFVDSLTNLASQTTYYVRAYATNGYGTAYGNELNFMASSANTVTDADGNVYTYVIIGTQTWMGSNLKTNHYQNGEPITNGTSANYDWNATANYLIGAYTFPNDDSMNNTLYGKYYGQAAVNDTRNVCPVGWHVPTDGDWETLEFYEGMAASDTGSFGLRGTIGGNLLTGGSSGLNIQAGGYMNFGTPGQPGMYQPVGNGGYGIFWTSTLQGDSWPPVNGATVNNYLRAFNVAGADPIYRQANDAWAVSVRCVKN